MQPILIVEDDSGRREFVLDSPVYSIGRDDRCDIKLHSQFVSRRHATLVQLFNDDGTYHYHIVDGNLKGKASANGILINGRRLQSHDLQHEDEVVFGPQVRCLYYQIEEIPNTDPTLEPLPVKPMEPMGREDILLYNRAIGFAIEEDWSAVKELVLQAIALQDKEAEYHSLLAVAYLGLGIGQPAVFHLRAAYNLNKDDALLQQYLMFMISGEFGWEDKPPPSSESNIPRNPHPFTPSTGAEASPDQGLSQAP